MTIFLATSRAGQQETDDKKRSSVVLTALLVHSRGFEVAGFYNRKRCRVDVLAEGAADLLGGESLDLLLQLLIPLHGEAELFVRRQQGQQGAVLGTRDDARIQVGLLGFGDFLGGEAFLQRFHQLVFRSEERRVGKE